MLQASNVHFCIKQKPIVDEVSLVLNAGELLAVLGPNGAGKSTFLKIISGEITCKQGTIGYNGHDITTLKVCELAAVRAVMPQHTQVNFPFTVQEVIELGLISTKVKHPAKLIAEVLTATNTEHLKGMVFNHLSGGEKQRVQLARVLVQIWEARPFPRYLLLDEPTSSLDIAQQHAVMQILSKLKSRNIGILVILHELNLAAQYADKIALLKNGRVAKVGEVADVLEKEILTYVFDYPIHIIKNSESGGLLVSAATQTNAFIPTTKQA